MHLASFHAKVIPISLLGFSVIAASLWMLCSTFPSTHAFGRTIVATVLVLGFFRLFLMIRNLIKGSRKNAFPDHPFLDRFDRIGVPLLEEVVRFILIAIVFSATGSILIKSMACIVGIIYALEKQVSLLWLFSPTDYNLHYKKFSRYYNIYLKNEIEHSWPKNPYEPSIVCESSSCMGVMYHDKTSHNADCCEAVSSHGAGSPTSSTTLVSDSNSLNSSAQVLLKPEFDFNFSSAPMGKSQLMPIECPQSHIENNSDIIQRLYTVSPKNTLYLQYENFELPTQINIGPAALLDSSLNVEELSFDKTIPDIESSSFHTTDTHFGGGGGGNFKYKFPDGSKLKLGGGAGFDFRRGSKHSKHLVNKETPYQYQSVSSDYKWYCWIFCFHKHQMKELPTRRVVNDSIRKKLSNYTLNNESSSLRVCASINLYHSTDEFSCSDDLESGPQTRLTQNALLYYKFNHFANRYLDIWNHDSAGNQCLIDPAFIRFGVPLTDISPFYIILFIFSTIIWQVLASITFALPYFMKHSMDGAVGLIFLITALCKLFCMNYTHLQSSRSYKFSILVEFIINLVLFVSLYIFCITGSSLL